MFVLPKEKSKPKVANPSLLILFGRPKAGNSYVNKYFLISFDQPFVVIFV